MIFPKHNIAEKNLIDPVSINQYQMWFIDALGPLGNLLSASKSGYYDRFPENLVVFNSNLYVEFPTQLIKLWYGDIDITKSLDKLINISEYLKYPIYILREMDGRFENEDNPNIDKFVIKLNNGNFETDTRIDYPRT